MNCRQYSYRYMNVKIVEIRKKGGKKGVKKEGSRKNWTGRKVGRQTGKKE